MKSKSNKIIFSFLIISLVIIIICYFLWAILIPIQDFSPMDKQETIRMQKELSLNYDLGRFLLYTGFSGLISSAILLISNKIRVEYGIRNRPPVRNFRPLYASKKSTKCENNRPIV